jgi:hypothetical protein
MIGSAPFAGRLSRRFNDSEDRKAHTDVFDTSGGGFFFE